MGTVGPLAAERPTEPVSGPNVVGTTDLLRGPLVALAVVLVLFVGLSSLIAVETPAYESADEPSHVQNIETMVSGHWYGMSSSCRLTSRGVVGCAGAEAHQAPLYYLVMAGWQWAVGPSAHPPYQGRAYLTPGRRGEFAQHRTSDLRFLLWLRLPNVAMGALTVLLTYLAVKLTTPDRWSPVVAASVVAFLPRFIFLSSFVTNDNLVDLLGAAFVLAAVRFVRHRSGWRMAWVGLVFGLLVATKLSTLPVGLVVVVLAWMVPGWWAKVGRLAAAAAAAAVTGGWYLIQNTVRYGDPLAARASVHYLELTGGLGTILAPYRVADPLHLVFVQVPARIGTTFWYQSGWNQFGWPAGVDLVLWAALALCLLGLVGRQVPRPTVVTLVSMTLAGLLSVWIVAMQTSTYQGRYVLVAAAAIAGLVALGVERWPLVVRFALPAMGLAGTLVAINQDILSVHWT
jgi:hypothetical protein